MRDPWGSLGSSVNIVYDNLHGIHGVHAVLSQNCSPTCLTRMPLLTCIKLCQALPLKPWPSPDPGSRSLLVLLRGGVSGAHGAQSAWSLCLCWGKLGENTPSRYADSLMGAREEVEARKCTLQTFQCSARNSIFSQQRFIHIYTSPNTDRKVVEKKKSWNCRGKLYVNAIK